MTVEKFKQAYKLQDEIKMLDRLIRYIEEGPTLDPSINEYAYIVNLIGTDNVHKAMKERKQYLEKEFESL